jgi:hypothetical protein
MTKVDWNQVKEDLKNAKEACGKCKCNITVTTTYDKDGKPTKVTTNINCNPYGE